MQWRAIGNFTVLVVTAVYGFLLAVGDAVGIFGLLLQILVLLSVWQYGYDIVRRLAQGHRELDAPELGSLVPRRGIFLHYAFFALAGFFLTSTPLLAGSLVLELARWSVLLVLVVIFPASAALMGMTRSVGVAFNPADVAACMGTFGSKYGKLVAACAGLVLAAVLLRDVIVSTLSIFGRLVYWTASVWTALAVFALIGAALYERREAFAIPGEYELEGDRQARLKRDAWKQSLDRAYASLRSGFDVQGHRTISQLLDSEQHSLEVYSWVFNELWDWEDKSIVLLYAAGYIAQLCKAGLTHEALDLFGRCRRVSNSFALEGSLARLLADYARSIGRHGIADELLQAAS